VYVFRDRVKELAREIGGRILPKWVSDRTNKLVDRRENKRVGTTSEVVRWLERKELPRDVLDARQYEDTLEQAVSEPTELVLQYNRNVRIDSAAIFESHQRAVAIDEILRPELRVCKTICVANKQENDCVYFAGIGFDQFLFFLRWMRYRAELIAFLEENRTKLDHLDFDVGFDYRMDGDKLTVIKSGYYGIF